MIDPLKHRFAALRSRAEFHSLRYVQRSGEYLSVRRNVSEPPHFSQDRGAIVWTCGRKAILISGDANIVTLLGMCTSVLISGDGNKVILSGVERLSVSGDGNTITYWPSTATLTDTGNGNTYFKR